MDRYLKRIDYSYVEKLRNFQHATFAQEFAAMWPRDLYSEMTSRLSTLISAEVENLSRCRKNHYRVQFNSKMMYLRALFVSLKSIIDVEFKLMTPNSERALHNYEAHIFSQSSNISFLTGAKGFVDAWTGMSFVSADNIITSIQETITQADSLVSLMSIEDMKIGNHKPQKVMRKSTDESIMAIIRRAQVEYYTLSPTVEQEAERLKLVVGALGAVSNWIRRVKMSAKNNGIQQQEVSKSFDKIDENNELVEDSAPVSENSFEEEYA